MEIKEYNGSKNLMIQTGSIGFIAKIKDDSPYLQGGYSYLIANRDMTHDVGQESPFSLMFSAANRDNVFFKSAAECKAACDARGIVPVEIVKVRVSTIVERV